MAFWDRLRKSERFTPVSAIIPPTSAHPFRIEEKQVYYMGAGWFITFERRPFRLAGDARVEYGMDGEYAFDVAYFADESSAVTRFFLPPGKYQFGDITCSPPLTIMDGVRIGDSFREVSNRLRKERLPGSFYHEGETRQLRDGEFRVTNLVIHYDQYQFLFFGNGKLSRLSGFVFSLPE